MAAKKRIKDITWRELQVVIKKWTLKECKEALDDELKGKARVQHLMRMHSRYNLLRAKEERTKLLK